MAAIKPFSYLTGETRPLPPKSGLRRPDEDYGSALQVNASPRPTRSPETSGDGNSTIQQQQQLTSPEPPVKDLSRRATIINNVRRDGDDSQLQGSRVHQTAADAEYKRELQKKSDLKNRLDISTAAAPDVRAAPPPPILHPPPSRTDEQADKYSRRDGGDSQLQGNRVQQTAADAEYKRELQKKSDLKNRLDISTAAAAPDVRAAPPHPPHLPPSRTDEQADKSLGADVPCTSRDHLYGKRQIDGQTGKTTKTETNLEASDTRQFLHNPVQINRRQREIAIGQNSSSSSSASCEIPAPYSYTEPMRPAPPLLHGAAQSPSDGQYRKKTGSGEGGLDDDDYLCPTSSLPTKDSLLDNFILVGGPSSKAESSGGQAVATEATKRLKLQELFDPPPGTMPTPQRRYSIHGVTNTESSDYHHHHRVVPGNKTSNPNGSGSNYSGIKSPAGALENSDYGMTGSRTETESSLHGCRSVSDRSTSTDCRTGKALAVAANHSTQRCRCDRRLCRVVAITALVTSVICLGSGFVAGWFGGQEACKGNGQC